MIFTDENGIIFIKALKLLFYEKIEMIAWSNHPIHQNKDYKYYLNQLRNESFISNEEYVDLILLPYRGMLRKETIDKMKIPSYKLIFQCEEKTLNPLILKKIADYKYSKYESGKSRRKITKLITQHATDKNYVVRQIRKGCYGYHLIGKFQLDSELMEKPLFMLKLYWCRLIN